MKDILGKVVHIVSPSEVVINLGSKDGITESSRFVLFAPGDEIRDPETGDVLGQLEIVRGKAEAKHVQEKMSTLRSLERKKVIRDRFRSGRFRGAVLPGDDTVVSEEVEVAVPFEGVVIGDLVRVL